MGVFDQIIATAQSPKNLLKKYVEEYIGFSPESKHLTLKEKTVLLLCQQAESKVEKLNSLEPDAEEGLIATIEHKKILAKVHFTPEQITLKEDCIEGQLRLLNPPEFETDSLVYRHLIAGWKTFLGGKIPNGSLPEGVRIDGDKIYYTFSRNQVKLIDTLFSGLENDSVLTTSLKQGELTIKTAVALNWKDFKFQNLLKLINTQQS